MKEVAINKSLQDFLKSYARNDLMRSFQNNEMKQFLPSKSKINEEISEALAQKSCKNMDAKKSSPNPSNSLNNQGSKKQPRKCDNPSKLPSTEDSMESCCPSTWICKNTACKAVLTSDDTFCKRCSCCICHLFDDNKDPSLWLVCSSDSDGGDWCGLSCHMECAIQRGKVGVVDHGQFMKLDGSYCCAACGKVSGIIGSWRKQLVVAKEARRQDVLCYRIFLSYRLLDGTSRFSDLHKIVAEAKTKLEKEIGPMNGVSARMARGIVSRLSIANDVQRLCSVAIEKADEWLSSNSNSDPKCIDSLPSACRFQFEEINSSSLVIVLRAPTSSSDSIKGYKLWYYKTRDEEPWKKEPVTFPRAQRRILISNLQPCTEYAFRIISFTEEGDLGSSEAKCFTKSVELIQKHTENNGNRNEGCSSSAKKEPKSSGFKVRKLGKILQLAWAQEEDACYEDLYNEEDLTKEESCELCNVVKPETTEVQQEPSSVVRRLDLNVASVPDLNADVIAPLEGSEEENELARSNGSGDSQTCAPASRKRSSTNNNNNNNNARDEICDGDSTLVNSSPLRFSNGLGQLDDNYEYCVKVIRWLECTGHIEKDFRMKFLTWFSLRSNEQERRVVITFIRTLAEEPSSLAGQLIDSFSEIVSCKRLKNGFCSKLWH